MSDEAYIPDEPELELLAQIKYSNGTPRLLFKAKTISSPEKIALISKLILQNGYIPAKIKIRDKFLFFANLKKANLI